MSHASRKCSKLAIETIEQGMKMFKVNSKDIRANVRHPLGVLTHFLSKIFGVVLLSLLLTLSIFHTLL